MAKQLLTGIDIGANSIKMAVCADGMLKKTRMAKVPENLIKDGSIVSYEALAQAIKATAKAGGITVRNAAISLPSQLSFVRRITMPEMTIEQLELNLPYEFRDYIPQDKDKYFYDYFVIRTFNDETGAPTMELMAAATQKLVVKEYSAMLKRAGFHLRTILPEELTFGNVIHNYEMKNPSEERRDYCIIDLGHEATRVHLFTGSHFEVTRTIEIGGRDIDAAIAEAKSVDVHVAQTYKHSNYEEVQTLPQCVAVYSGIAVEIMRVINFYGFNYPDSNLTKAYICGGGAKIQELLRQIKQNITLEIAGVTDLMPKPEKGVSGAFLYPVALGATMQ